MCRRCWIWARAPGERARWVHEGKQWRGGWRGWGNYQDDSYSESKQMKFRLFVHIIVFFFKRIIIFFLFWPHNNSFFLNMLWIQKAIIENKIDTGERNLHLFQYLHWSFQSSEILIFAWIGTIINYYKYWNLL